MLHGLRSVNNELFSLYMASFVKVQYFLRSGYDLREENVYELFEALSGAGWSHDSGRYETRCCSEDEWKSNRCFADACRAVCDSDSGALNLESDAVRGYIGFCRGGDDIGQVILNFDSTNFKSSENTDNPARNTRQTVDLIETLCTYLDCSHVAGYFDSGIKQEELENLRKGGLTEAGWIQFFSNPLLDGALRNRIQNSAHESLDHLGDGLFLVKREAPCLSFW
jgi:hypothetical protein